MNTYFASSIDVHGPVRHRDTLIAEVMIDVFFVELSWPRSHVLGAVRDDLDSV